MLALESAELSRPVHALSHPKLDPDLHKCVFSSSQWGLLARIGTMINTPPTQLGMIH